MKTTVSLVKCEDYDRDRLLEAVRQSIRLSGFDLASLKGKRVALKPNLLMPFSPDRAVITHPAFFRAVAETVKHHTDNVVVIESPNFFPLQSTMKKTGYLDIAEDLGLEIAEVTRTAALHYDRADKYKSVEISEAFFDVDVIVNIPKLKTHGFTHYTGAVKNLFGSMPGLSKSRMHMKAPAHPQFAGFLLDLYGALNFGFEKKKAFLHVMDAVVGMEGEGPGPSGRPKPVGAVLAGTDAVALDYVAANLVCLDVKKILTVTGGFSRAYGVTSPEEITVAGEPLESMKVTDFKPSKNTAFSGVVWPLTSKTIKNLFTEKPVPHPESCVLCYYCKKVCPAGAIDTAAEGKKVPRYDYKKCIRCFCCMETCPESAITAKKGTLQWMMNLFD
ncbi:MAG TPA: DUF362 domain-containing protein [Spirochaetota bacterium]|nr:DUF362 domain-containing protein [Spirochaetota bacterium]HPR46345.1 DUF362 domain-containing protein [Spirochaetota bacterium]